MELFKLLLHLEHQVLNGTTRRNIRKVTNDTRKTQANDVFVCIKGFRQDGHEWIDEAIRKGAVAVVIENNQKDLVENIPNEITVITVEDTRYALSVLAAAYYGFPAEKIKIIGITGTKGKSTTTYYVVLNLYKLHIMQSQGKSRANLMKTID